MPPRPTTVELSDADRRKLRDARERLGLSQGEVARAAGCSYVMIGLVERGQKSPSAGLLRRICRALGLEVRLTIVERRRK